MNFADLDIDKSYTYADYLKWNFKERVELIKGKIFNMSPSPSTNHQLLSMNISGYLWDFLKDDPCTVYTAPFDVRIPKKSDDDRDIMTVVQPDICVICDPEKVDARGCLGAPDIVVEILSPGNNAKEMNIKYDIYEQAGVKEYWIVSPQDKTFLVYTLRDGAFVPSKTKAPGDIITSSVLPGFTLNLEKIFSRI